MNNSFFSFESFSLIIKSLCSVFLSSFFNIRFCLRDCYSASLAFFYKLIFAGRCVHVHVHVNTLNITQQHGAHISSCIWKTIVSICIFMLIIYWHPNQIWCEDTNNIKTYGDDYRSHLISVTQCRNNFYVRGDNVSNKKYFGTLTGFVFVSLII